MRTPARGVTVGRALAAVGCVVTAVGATLPWVEVNAFVTTITYAGLDREGPVTLLLAVSVLAILWLRPWTRLEAALVAACGALVFAVGAAYVADLSMGYELIPTKGLLEEVGREVSDPGSGVYVTGSGGLLVLVGGVVGLLRV